jgi:hypothetical protein
MIHYMPTIETLDPRIQDIYKGMRPPGTPRYGLGYIEQCDKVIRDCRFSNPLPSDISRPSVEEMHKFHIVMRGCQKGSINEDWIKRMLNWDLFTNPETKEFNTVVSDSEKLKLSKDWQKYIIENDLWISFFEWRKLNQKGVVQMMGEYFETPPKHKWKGIDGHTVESNSTFPKWYQSHDLHFSPEYDIRLFDLIKLVALYISL